MRRMTLLFLLVIGLCAGTTPAMATTPQAITSTATATTTSAHITGYVHDGGEPTTYYFQWGTTAEYGQTTTEAVVQAAANGGGCSGCRPVSADLSTLPEGATYHYRVVAKNATSPDGIFGEDRTVTTQTTPPPPTDTDGDNVPDSTDGCDTQPGPSSNNGCPVPPPDRDFDGVPDSSDACPDQPAQGSANGCPPPPADSDFDGTPDNFDACPTVQGPPSGSNHPPGCPAPPLQPTSTGPKPPTPDDLDADGVLNAKDMCPKSFQMEKVDADGCGPFSGRAGFGARSTLEIQDDPGVSLQCNNNKGKVCKARLTMILSAASAKKLGIARKLFDVTINATKEFQSGAIVTGGRDMRFSRKVEKALKRAYDDRVPVTMTFDGTLTHGTKTYAYKASTFTMRRKPPGGSAYRVEPFLDHGDKGASSGGLTRKADPNDF